MAETYIVGVTGGSGSGKTSFVGELRKLLGDRATLVSQDDYYFPMGEQQQDERGVHNFDLPTSIDSDTMHQELLQLLAGKAVQRKEYTFETVYRDDRNQTTGVPEGRLQVFKPAPLLIVEGLFVMNHPGLRSLMDLRVFIDASDVAKLCRRIKRDRVERGLPLEDVLYRYEAHVHPAYREFILPQRANAHVVINNNEDFTEGLALLGTYLLQKV